MSEETIPCGLHCEAWWLWHGRAFAGNCFPNWKNTTRRETESAALSLFQRDIIHDQQTDPGKMFHLKIIIIIQAGQVELKYISGFEEKGGRAFPLLEYQM